MTDNTIIPKKKSLVKKILIGIGLFIVTLLILIIALPYFFKDDIKAFIKSELNNIVETNIEFKDIDVSLIKHFPNFNANIIDLNVLGKGDNKDLFSAKKISLDMDLMSIISSSRPIEIIDFTIVNPNIDIVIDNNGNSNYDIIKETSESQDSNENFRLKDLKLKRYSITDAEISYFDMQSNQKAILSKLNHIGSGNFKDIVFKLKTSTTIDKINLVVDGIPYFKNTELDWNIDFDVDFDKMLFIIDENTITLNDLNLISKGQFLVLDDHVNMDISLNAPGNNFKEIFSMIPNAYIKDYKNVKAKGNFSLNGEIKGNYYFDEEIYPNFDFNILAKNGYINYPELPLPIENINCDISINKKGTSLNSTIVNINPMTFSIESEKMNVSMNLRNILTDPLSSGKFNGTIDLGALSKAFPIEDISNLNGKLLTDLTYKFNQSLTVKELNGKAKAININAKYADYPLVKIKSADANFSANNIDLNNLEFNAGNSDINGKVLINNPLNYFSKNKAITINFNGLSNYIDANEWLVEEDNKQSENKSPDQDKDFLNFLKNRLVFEYKYYSKKILYEDFEINNMNINGKYNNNNLNINNQSFYFSGSEFNINGNLNKIISWLMEEKTMVGYVNLTSPHFDMDKYMGSDENGNEIVEETTSTPFELPDKMDIIINTNISKINYTGKNLSNLNGKLHLKDKTVKFNNFKAYGLGGMMKFDGNIATHTNEKPSFDIKYNLSKMKYEEFYNSIVSIKSLVPVSKFIKGIFNADFSFKGTMSNDFTPDLNSLSASGLIHTLNAYINDYPGLNELASKLQVNSLKKISIEDTKNTFEISNGIFEIKPFDVEYDDMKFKIAGLNKLDKTVDYVIHASIPKEKVGKIPGGNSLNKGLDFVIGKAKSKGLDIKVGEILNMNFLLSGPYNKPELKVNFVGTQAADGTVTNKDNVVDKIKTKTDSQINTTKNKAKIKVTQTVDSSKIVVKNKVDETTTKLKNKAKEELENIIDSTTKDKAEKDLKDALKNLNPFKKKK